MNLPWVVAAAIPASQVARQVTSAAATSVSHFFGELLQNASSAPAANGPSAAAAQASNHSIPNSDSKSFADRVDALRNLLSKSVKDIKSRYGWEDVGLQAVDSNQGSISIVADGRSAPEVDAPEPIRTELENLLAENPAIGQEFSELAVLHKEQSPLGWLPRSAEGIEKLRIWLSPTPTS